MRLFLAINLPSGMKKQLAEFSGPLKGFGKLKLVEEENIHLTLKFLGEAKLGDVVPLLEKIKFAPFEASLEGVGVFPNAGRARVIWVGCEKGAQEIIALHKAVEAALPQFERGGDFHPHATLARVSFLDDKTGLANFIEKNKIKDFGTFTADSFDLMKSELSRAGPKYEIVRKFPL